MSNKTEKPFDERYFLRSAISQNRMRLREPWQTVESIRISKENIVAARNRLAALSYVNALLGEFRFDLSC